MASPRNQSHGRMGALRGALQSAMNRPTAGGPAPKAFPRVDPFVPPPSQASPKPPVDFVPPPVPAGPQPKPFQTGTDLIGPPAGIKPPPALIGPPSGVKPPTDPFVPPPTSIKPPPAFVGPPSQSGPTATGGTVSPAAGGTGGPSSTDGMLPPAQAFAHGGVLRDPVVGTDLRTGGRVTLGEEGPERISPMSDPRHAGLTQALLRMRAGSR